MSSNDHFNTEKDPELIAYAYKNLNGVPHHDDYEKMISGMKYSGYHDEGIYSRIYRHENCLDYANIRMKDFKHWKDYNEAREKLVAKIYGKVGKGCFIEAPFYVDYGYNITVGKNFYANFNLTILDCGLVTIGDDVMCGPNVTIVTVTHPTNPFERKIYSEWAKPVKIGNNVWLSTNCTILPGVTIGDNVAIGAGSVVTKDIPANTVAVGVPCKVIRTYTEEDAREDLPKSKSAE